MSKAGVSVSVGFKTVFSLKFAPVGFKVSLTDSVSLNVKYDINQNYLVPVSLNILSLRFS